MIQTKKVTKGHDQNQNQDRSSRSKSRNNSSKKGKKTSARKQSNKPKKTPPEREAIRLQKVLAQAGIASRREAETHIVNGLVRVNGKIMRELGTKIIPGRDKVTFRGAPVSAEPKVYYLLNKPDAVVCSVKGTIDERGRSTVLSLLPGVRERLFTVGRLDYHSRGLILLTNDGDFAQALAHPRSRVVKTYHAKFSGHLSREELEQLKQGVTLEDGTLTEPADEVLVIKETTSNTWVQLGIHQGLNRQIRRMGEALNRPVLKLIRVAIADLSTDSLKEGNFRRLSETEIAQLQARIEGL